MSLIDAAKNKNLERVRLLVEQGAGHLILEESKVAEEDDN